MLAKSILLLDPGGRSRTCIAVDHVDLNQLRPCGEPVAASNLTGTLTSAAGTVVVVANRVYLLIIGTYTPVCLLVLGGAWRVVVLVMVWIGAGAAVVFKFVWVDAPKWVAATLGVALGWVGVVVLPQLVARLNPAAVALLGVGGLAYTAGAII